MAVINDVPGHNATIFGTDQADTINGSDFNDAIFGGKGNDEIHGGIGRDFLTGGKGDDVLIGGLNVDTIDGGKGDDFIADGPGRGWLTGGEGADTFHFDRADDPGAVLTRSSIITDFDCEDKLDFTSYNHVTWDSAKGAALSGQGHEIAILVGHVGDTVDIVEVEPHHWVGMLMA